MNNIIYLIIGISTAIGILISPIFGLALTVILIPISTQITIGGSFLGLFSMLTPIKVIGTLTFISTLIHHGSKKGTWVFLKKPQMRFILFFLIWIFISGLTQPGFATRENFTMFTSNIILGITMLILLTGSKKFRLFLWLVTIAIFCICINSILSHTMTSKAEGAAYGSNEFAILILPFIAIAFFMVPTERKKILKLVLLTITSLILLTLVFTVSRGGIIGFGGMLLISILKSKRKIITIALVCLTTIIFINVMPQNLRDRFSKTQISTNAYGIGDGDIDSTTRRYYLAQAAWRIFLSHPVFGIGIGNYFYENRNYAPVYPGRAHNMYLEIMAEMGIIGIILFLYIFLYTFKALNKIIKSKTQLNGYAKGLFIGLIGFIIAGIFLHAEQDRILWFLIFASLALERIYEKHFI